ncbi:MAG: hypothetical protein ACFB14_09170 [Leptolyngbyaceae cyanobacterium]
MRHLVSAIADSGITGGRAIISGSLTQKTAQELTIQLRSQALPTALELTAVEAVDLIPECRRQAAVSILKERLQLIILSRILGINIEWLEWLPMQWTSRTYEPDLHILCVER